MWFGTDKGVVRFDGYDMQVYTHREGLASAGAYNFFQDSKGRIWFLMDHQVSYYLDGNLYNSSVDPTIDFELPNFILDATEDEDGNIWFVSHLEGVAIVRPEGPPIVLRPEDYPLLRSNARIFKQPDGRLLTFGEEGIHSPELSGETLKISTLSTQRISSFERLARLGQSRFVKTGTSGWSMLDLKGNKVDLPDHEGMMNSNWVYRDRSGSFWSATLDGAWHFEKGLPNEENGSKMLDGKRVSRVFEDQEGNYWFSTLDDGIFMTPGLEVLRMGKEEGVLFERVSALHQEAPGRFWAAGENGRYGLFEKGEASYFYSGELPYKERQQEIKDIFPDGKGNIWFREDEKLFRVNESGQVLERLFPPGNLKFAQFTEQGDLITGGSYGTFLFPEEFIPLLHSLDHLSKEDPNIYQMNKFRPFRMFPHRTLSGLETSDGSIWLGTAKGLFRFTKDQPTEAGPQVLPDNNYLSPLQVVDLAEGPDRTLLVAVPLQGIFLLNDQGYYLIDEKDGLSSLSINCILLDHRRFLWVGTDHGIFRLFLDPAGKIHSHHISRSDGLHSSVITDLSLLGDILLAATPAGITRIRTERLPEYSNPPQVYISRVEKMKDHSKVEPEEELVYNANDLRIHFRGLSLRSKGEMQYLYRMEGLSGTWNRTTNTSIDFISLEPGKYNFQVRAANSNGVWSRNTAEFSFHVRPAIWQTWLFKIAMAFLLIAGGALFTWYRFKQTQEYNQLERQRSESEQKALRSQMTPHFLYNSLNSIQHLISEGDRVEAMRFTSKFSRLMRRTLENSTRRLIPLSEELDNLRLYLELESLRFEDKFDYVIEADSELDIDLIQIPPLLLQPYVENSLWHGLLHKGQKGRIRIAVEQKGEKLICIIEDDGIGRAEAQLIAKKNGAPTHVPMGMRITRERLDLLSAIEGMDVNVRIRDLVAPDGQPGGTCVTLELPPNLT